MRVDLKFLLEFGGGITNHPTSSENISKQNTQSLSNPYDRFNYTTSYTGDVYDRKARWGTNTPYGVNPKSGVLNINVSAEKRGVPDTSVQSGINPAFLKKIDDQPDTYVSTVMSPFKMNKSPADSRMKEPIHPHADSNPVKSILDRNMQSNYTRQAVMNRMRMG